MNKKGLSAARHGFTLIELLIVIAIIGILSVALVPTGMSALKKARDGSRITHLGTIATAMQQYVLDKNACPSSLTDADLLTYVQGGALPKDPSSKADYSYTKDAGNYCVAYALLEVGGGNYNTATDGTPCLEMATVEKAEKLISGLAVDAAKKCFVVFAER